MHERAATPDFQLGRLSWNADLHWNTWHVILHKVILSFQDSLRVHHLHLHSQIPKLLYRRKISLSSSPSSRNLTLQGTSPDSLRKYSIAFILVINSPLSSEDPLPKIKFPSILPLNGSSFHNSIGSGG